MTQNIGLDYNGFVELLKQNNIQHFPFDDHNLVLIPRYTAPEWSGLEHPTHLCHFFYYKNNEWSVMVHVAARKVAEGDDVLLSAQAAAAILQPVCEDMERTYPCLDKAGNIQMEWSVITDELEENPDGEKFAVVEGMMAVTLRADAANMLSLVTEMANISAPEIDLQVVKPV